MKWPRLPSRRRPRSSRIHSVEVLEARLVLSAAFDVTDLTELRSLPEFAEIDGALAGGERVGIAVIDSGVMGSHADLSGNFVAFFDAVATDARSDGIVTAADSTSFDREGHGTHVAGIAASTNASIGVAYEAALIGIRGLPGPNEPLPRHDTLISSLQWVEENHEQYNIKVVNLSVQDGSNSNSSGPGGDVARRIDSLESLGITVVASTGNSYADYMTLGASFPAIFASLSVANTWEDNGAGDNLAFLSAGQEPRFVAIDTAPTVDQLAASSQRSTLANQVAAPGSTILSTWNDGGYNTLAGTSMASAFVSGLVALVQDAAMTFGGRYLGVSEVVGIVRSTAETIFDAQTPATQRAPIHQNPDGSASLGQAEDLVESGQNYLRVNALNAVRAVRDLMGSHPGGDADSLLTNAGGVPPLDGSQPHSAIGNLGTDGALVIGPNDVDLFRVDVQSPGRIRALAERVAGGRSFDPYLRVFDASGMEIAFQNDSAAGDLYPDLTTDILPAGVYYVGISSFANTAYNPLTGANSQGGGSTGDYQLSLSLSNPDFDGVVGGARDVDLSAPNTFDGRSVTSRFLDQFIDEFPFSSLGSPNHDNPLTDHLNSSDDPNQQRTSAVEVDFFQFVAPDSGALTIEASTQRHGTAGIDSYLEIYRRDAFGNLVTIAGNDDANGTDSRLQVHVEMGETYFVAVTTSQNQNFHPEDPFARETFTDPETGFYDLFFTFTNGDGNGSALGPSDFSSLDLDSDGIVEGTIGSDLGQAFLGAEGGAKDVDFFEFTATEDGLLDVSLMVPEGTANPLEGVLGLWGLAQDGNSIQQLSETQRGTPRSVLEVTAGQTILVSVTGVGNQGFHWASFGGGLGGDTGDYRLSIQQRPADDLAGFANNSIQNHTPTPVGLRQLISGNIGRDGDLVLAADDIDLFEYTATTDQLVQIQVSASQEGSADTFLRVFDAQGNELAANDNAHAETKSSQTTLFFPAGETFFIGINGSSANAGLYDPLTGENAADGSTGDYTLWIAELSPPIYAVGADAGGGPHVRVFDTRTDEEIASLYAYHPDFKGGVRVAVGDVTGDGIDDVVTAPGAGGGPHIRVLDGATGLFRTEPRFDFLAFQSTMNRGVNIAVGDVNGDGIGDIIVAPDGFASPVVRVYSGSDGAMLHSFFAYNLNINSGVRVAAGDVNGDGFDDIITVPGPGFPAHVRVFAGQQAQSGVGRDLKETAGLRIGSTMAFPGFLGGAYVASGDVDGDGLDDVITGAGAGGGPHVLVFNASPTGPDILRDFFAYHPNFTGGVRVGTSEFYLDRRVEILTAPGPGGGPHVRVFDAQSDMADVVNSFPFGKFLGGVFVAGSGAYRHLEPAQRLDGRASVSQQLGDTLRGQDLAGIADAAIARFADIGLSAGGIEHLQGVQFSISDLPANQLGLAIGNTILLDRDAAGAGWFIDPTPHDDEEFQATNGSEWKAISPSAAGVDLLSVILHELSHHWGGDHADATLDPRHLLAESILPGRRRSLSRQLLDSLYADDTLFSELLHAP